MTDVIMPRMIGNDVATRLRADAVLKSTPIVFLSAVGVKKCADGRYRALDGSPCIPKPASLEELIEGIECNLQKPAIRSNPASAANSLREHRATSAPTLIYQA